MIRSLGTVQRIQRGEAMPFAREQTSAINKSAVAEATINSFGLQGDEQADRFFHGGTLQAVHQMPVCVYALIRQHFPDLAIYDGMLGENLGIGDMDEGMMCIGDVVKVGNVLLQLTRPRRPCWKIDVQLNHRGMSRFLQREACVGWYYRVLQEGTVRQGDSATLQERPNPWATLDRLWQLNNYSEAARGAEAAEIHRWLALSTLQKPFYEQLAKRVQGQLF